MASTCHLALHLCSRTQGGPSHLGPGVEHLQTGLPWVLARQGDGRVTTAPVGRQRRPQPTRAVVPRAPPISAPQLASLAVCPSPWWGTEGFQSQARCPRIPAGLHHKGLGPSWGSLPCPSGEPGPWLCRTEVRPQGCCNPRGPAPRSGPWGCCRRQVFRRLLPGFPEAVTCLVGLEASRSEVCEGPWSLPRTASALL